MRASGTVTLLKGPKRNILVDAGSPWDKEEIVQGKTATCLYGIIKFNLIYFSSMRKGKKKLNVRNT